MIAYSNDFVFLMWLTLATLPLLLIIGSSRVPRRSAGPAAATEDVHAME